MTERLYSSSPTELALVGIFLDEHGVVDVWIQESKDFILSIGTNQSHVHVIKSKAFGETNIF